MGERAGTAIVHPAARVVAAARGAVGARFRLHGRDPATGIDCVGLCALALRAGGFAGRVPDDYALRSKSAAAIAALLDGHLVRVATTLPGDVLLFAAGPAQCHLAVLVPGGFVHADAVARRVIERPGAPPWPCIGAWRLEGEG